MTTEQQVKIIEELAEVILKGNAHIKMGGIRKGVVANCYTEFKGSGNERTGFKNIAISIMNESIILRLDLDPSPLYDLFNPNPHFSLFESNDIDKAKNIVKQMLQFSENLTSGLGELILK